MLGALTGYSPTTLLDYRAGRRKPTRTFVLDLLEKAQNTDLEFHQIAAALGLRWIGSKDPAKHRRHSFPEYFSTIRLLSGKSRDQFAIKLRVTTEIVFDVEHGSLPEPNLLKRLAREFLQPNFDVPDILSAFRNLSPTTQDLEIQERIQKMRIYDVGDPQRRRLEQELALEMKPTAIEIARRAAWRLNRPEYAEEAWGEGLALAIRFQDPRRGYFLPYLRSRIRGLVCAQLRSTMQTGTTTILANYGPAMREAEDFLHKELSRTPSEEEIAEYLDVSSSLIGEVRRAQYAAHAQTGENLEFLLTGAIDIRPSYEAYALAPTGRAERIRTFPDDWREILERHFEDKEPINDIAHALSTSPGNVTSILELAVASLR